MIGIELWNHHKEIIRYCHYGLESRLHHSEDHYEHYYFDKPDPERSFRFSLINMIGIQAFDDWFWSIAEEERTITNLKKHFNLNQEQIDVYMSSFDQL